MSRDWRQSEWLADIGAAADELHYHITRIEPGEVELIPLTAGDRDLIVIRTILLSGDYLRKTLQAQPEPVSQKALDFGVVR